MANVVIANLIEDADGYTIGYEIRVYDATNGKDVEEYTAGNSALESTSFVPPGSMSSLSEVQLEAYMDITAHEMSREYDAAISFEDPYRLEREC